MTDIDPSRWAWHAGATGEHFPIGPCATREAAIEEAISACVYDEIEDPEDVWHIGIHVVEAVMPKVGDMTVDAVRFLEHLDDRYSDWGYEESLFANVTKEQTADLETMLTAALHAWAERHGVRFPSYHFLNSRHEGVVVLPHPEEAPT